jgi:hypothetical protein
MQNDREEDDEEGSLKDFIDDGDESEASGSDSDIQEVDESGEDVRRVTRQNKVLAHYHCTMYRYRTKCRSYQIILTDKKLLSKLIVIVGTVSVPNPRDFSMDPDTNTRSQKLRFSVPTPDPAFRYHSS